MRRRGTPEEGPFFVGSEHARDGKDRSGWPSLVAGYLVMPRVLVESIADVLVPSPVRVAVLVELCRIAADEALEVAAWDGYASGYQQEDSEGLVSNRDDVEVLLNGSGFWTPQAGEIGR